MTAGSNTTTSTQFVCGHAHGAGWEDIAYDCLAQLGPLDSSYTLGFVYFTDALINHAPEIIRFLRSETPVPHWVGTVGLGVVATSTGYFDEPAMVLMAAKLPADSFAVLAGAQQPFAPMPDIAVKPYFGVIHADPHTSGLASVVALCAGHMASGFLVGGVSSSRERTMQIADSFQQGGLSGVLFAESVGVASRLTQGCVPIGKTHVITDCDQNVVLALDHRPALDVLREDVGEVLAQDWNRLAGYIYVALPIAGSDRQDYLVRNIVGIDPRHKVIGVGEVLESGMSLMFCKRDTASARLDMRRMLGELKASLAGPPKGGLYFTCVARGRNTFSDDHEELRLIREYLGEFPLAGFFANGEISHDRLYGYTGVLTVFT